MAHTKEASECDDLFRLPS